MRGLPGTITRCAAPVESFTNSTFCHVLPPSAVRYTPRSGFGRWQDMAEGAVRERLDRCCAPGDGTGQPPHVVRRDVAVRAPTAGPSCRRHWNGLSPHRTRWLYRERYD